MSERQNSDQQHTLADTKSNREINAAFISVETLYFPTPALLPFSWTINSTSHLQRHAFRLSSLFRSRFSFPVPFSPREAVHRSPRSSSTLKHDRHPSGPSKDFPGWKTSLREDRQKAPLLLLPYTLPCADVDVRDGRAHGCPGRPRAPAGAPRPLAADHLPCAAVGAETAPRTDQTPYK